MDDIEAQVFAVRDDRYPAKDAGEVTRDGVIFLHPATDSLRVVTVGGASVTLRPASRIVTEVGSLLAGVNTEAASPPYEWRVCPVCEKDVIEGRLYGGKSAPERIWLDPDPSENGIYLYDERQKSFRMIHPGDEDIGDLFDPHEHFWRE